MDIHSKPSPLAENVQCDSCLRYANEGILGHFTCSAHRDCAGKEGWAPDNCTACLQFRENYSTMNTEDKNAALKDLRWMLKRMESNFSTGDFTWGYLNARDIFLGEPINSPESSLSHASPNSPGLPENEDFVGEHTSQNPNEGVLVMFQEFLCGFSNFTTEISKKMENLSQQNTLLLNKRSEQENFERKRSHSPEYSSSPGSFVPHYNKKCKSHSISATSTPVQDEQSGQPTVEAP